MRFFSQLSLASLSLYAVSVTGNPIQKRQGGAFAITGFENTAPRLEIGQLQGNFQQWNLFLTGLQRLQFTNQDDELSYYQITRIHGAPPAPWDGVQGSGNLRTGWAAHNSNLFTTWHRPYLSLLEMMIVAKARELVEEMDDGPEKDEWRASCDTLRLPYWDWAALPSGSYLPAAVSAQAVDVTFPGGRTARIANPLYEYRFRPRPAGLPAPVTNWDFTARGVDLNNVNSPSNNGQVENNLRGGYNNVRNNVYNVLTADQTFNQFSNSGSEDSGPAGNLEMIHNGIHASFGGSHMLYPIVSAFDPVFFLHHANVDRLTAIFQKLHSNTWVTPFNQEGNSYWFNNGDQLAANTNMEPFHSSTSGAFWTSDGCRDVTALGYTYSDLGGSVDDTRRRVNQLYAPANAAVAKRADETDRTYIAVVEAPWTALDSNYIVRLFVGQPTKSAANWMQDDNYVGSVAVLTRPGVDTDAKLKGSVVLTDKINERNKSGNVIDLLLDTVVGFLKSDLVVKIEKDGKEVPRSEVPGLKVKVVSTEVRRRTSDTEFPEWIGDFMDNLNLDDLFD